MANGQFLAASPLTGAQLLKRPEVKIDDLMEWIGEGLHVLKIGSDALRLGSACQNPALSEREGSALSPLGDRVARDGVFSSRRGTGEGVGQDGLLSREEARRIETDFKYEGYLQQQERQMERMKRAESRRIPDWFDYKKVSGLSREVVEKLTRVHPLTLGQASRIPGITPAAVSLVNCYIEIFQRRAAEQASV
jgi:tRNA uridine 5-carboxymethylaminomethyl modification enzyme